jgi:hypothetical protein
MKAKIYLIMILAFFSLQFTAAQPPDADTVKRNHLLVKTEVLLPLLTWIDTKNDPIIFGVAGELKFKSRFSAQLSVYYLYVKNEDIKERGFLFMPEARYYMGHHFLGVYFKFLREQIVNYTMYNKEVPRNFYSSGVLYGYQREFGRFSIEGFLNAGIRKMVYPNGSYGPSENKTDFDFFIGGLIGWRVF